MGCKKFRKVQVGDGTKKVGKQKSKRSSSNVMISSLIKNQNNC